MTYLLNVQVFMPIELLTGATVTIVSSDYMVDESQSSVEVCASLTDIPAGGLECEVVATINTTDRTKASMSPIVVHVRICVSSNVSLLEFEKLLKHGMFAKFGWNVHRDEFNDSVTHMSAIYCSQVTLAKFLWWVEI